MIHETLSAVHEGFFGPVVEKVIASMSFPDKTFQIKAKSGCVWNAR